MSILGWVSRFPQSPQRLDNPVDLFRAFGVFAAEVGRELFRACAGVGGEEVADEANLLGEFGGPIEGLIDE
jgi:hypothetical protein